MLNFGLNSASILAQVNFGANSASILGIFLAVAGAALYFLRTVRPELSRDQDIFFAAVGLVCGFILVFQGWRLDPILQFGQLLLVGTTVFFAVESIRLRAIATEQAKRNTKIVDDGRDVSDRPRYERRKAEVDASLDPLPYDDYYEEERPRARISGTRETRSSRDDYYEDEAPRRTERRSSNERPETGERPRRRGSSSRPTSRNPERIQDDDWGSSSRPTDDWDNSDRSGEVRKPARRGNNGTSRPEIRDSEDVTPSRPRKRRPPIDSSPRTERFDDDDAMPVEYKPIDQPDEKPDNPNDYDEV
ncbi:MAG: Ycf66 family protein [Heteroscytonema crispum UTEX LB 1556]